jgi:hypothetical protein
LGVIWAGVKMADEENSQDCDSTEVFISVILPYNMLLIRNGPTIKDGPKNRRIGEVINAMRDYTPRCFQHFFTESMKPVTHL